MTTRKPTGLDEALINNDSATDKAIKAQAIREIYLAYLTYTGTMSERRYRMNTFFLTMQTGSFVLIGYIFSKDAASELISVKYVICSLGIVVGYYWYRMIRAHKQLMTGKFTVIHKIETLLPIAPFTAEWHALGKGDDAKVYRPVTEMESRIPWVFVLAHAILLIFWATGYSLPF